MGTELSKEVKELKQKVEELVAKTNGSIRNADNNNVSDSYSAHQVVQEIQERNIRKNNIIVFSLPEQTNRNGDKNIILDMLRLANLESVLKDIKHFRICRTPLPNEPRPKLIMDCESTMKKIFKDIKLIKESKKFKDIVIVNDRTPMQMSRYRRMKTELEERKQQGENDIQISVDATRRPTFDWLIFMFVPREKGPGIAVGTTGTLGVLTRSIMENYGRVTAQEL
nr:unnamed protein product [Callosobruchus analis]